MGLQFTLPHKHTHAPDGSDPLHAVATSGRYSDLSGKPPLGTAAEKNIGKGESEVSTGDIHKQFYERNSDAASQPVGYGATIHQVVLANDTRLANPRTPTSHSHDIFGAAPGFVPSSSGAGTKFLRGDATWADAAPALGNLHLRIKGTTNLFNTNNSTEYVFPWNEIFSASNTAILSPHMGQYNILISPEGAGEWYYFEARYSSFDITNPNAFMRIRLRMSSSLITGSNGGTLMGVVAQGRTGTGSSGEASISGSLTLQISGPTYCVFTILHDSAQVSGYPVFTNDNGLQPYIYIRRLGI